MSFAILNKDTDILDFIKILLDDDFVEYNLSNDNIPDISIDFTNSNIKQLFNQIIDAYESKLVGGFIKNIYKIKYNYL
jgi:hypothetical protein